MTTTSKIRVTEAGAQYFDDNIKRFTEAIINLDQEGAERITDDLLSTRQKLGDIYLRVMAPALVNVGEQWYQRAIGVGAQKLATEIVMAQMDRLRVVFTKRNLPSPYRVLICCVEGEWHTIGARMLADLCLARSLNVDFLGPDVSSDALINFIKGRQPQVLALSMSTAEGLAKARAVTDALERVAPSLPVVLGGQGVPKDAKDAKDRSVGRVCETAGDAVEGVATISKLIRAERPNATLKEYQLVLAHRVRELRAHKGWTQERLAEATRVTRVCIVAIEGAKQNVSMDILIRLSNALDVAPETLLSVER